MHLIGPLAIPDPLNSHEQWEKYHNLDLDRLSPRNLCVERWRVEQALALFDLPPDAGNHDLAWDWLWARYEAIQARQ